MSGEHRMAVDPMTKSDSQETKREKGIEDDVCSTTQEIASHEINIEDVELRSDEGLIELLKNQENKNNEKGEQDYKIGWVPQIMMQNCQDADEYFKPKFFFIGPLYGYPKVEIGFWSKTIEMENKDLKVKLAAKFIKSLKTPESSLEEIRNNIQGLRACFVEGVICEYDDDTLARFLFFEGCAILEFIRRYFYNGLKELGIDDHQASLIREDLFLLENQIPFRVLQLLLEMTEDPKEWKGEIVTFLFLNNIMVPPENRNDLEKICADILERIDQNENVHLLDLLHSLIISQHDDVSPGENNEEDHNIQVLPWFRNLHYNCCLTQFAWFRRKKTTPGDSSHTKFLNFDTERFFRNVQELKSAGIKFKPTSGLATVSFNNNCFNIKGCLKLPTLIVDDWTERKIMNLVAYEMYLSGNYKKDSYYVTSYIKFMDFLIDREEDVKELRASRLLWNRLSSDVVVAKLFNDLGSKCFEPPNDKYANIRRDIQTHCERNCAVWMAQVYHEHFSSPWTVVALLAAIVVISLTAVQAWFAVNPKKS